jgi:hypothetical protein
MGRACGHDNSNGYAAYEMAPKVHGKSSDSRASTHSNLNANLLLLLKQLPAGRINVSPAALAHRKSRAPLFYDMIKEL